MRKNSIKNTRINGEVRRELSNIILNEIKDPRICPMTSVVEADIAFRALAKSINLRNTPEIRFVMDQSIEYGVHMSKLIDDVNQGNSKEEDEEDDQA